MNCSESGEEILKGRRNKPEKITNIISNIKKSDIVKLGFELVPVWEKWKDIVGEEFAPFAEPSGFRRGVLYIKVRNNTIMHRLSFDRERILMTIKEILKKDLVKDLFFELDERED